MGLESQMGDLILGFLIRNKGKKFHIKKLFREISEKEQHTTYQTVLKWCDILIASGKINSERYGRVKVVWYGD